MLLLRACARVCYRFRKGEEKQMKFPQLQNVYFVNFLMQLFDFFILMGILSLLPLPYVWFWGVCVRRFLKITQKIIWARGEKKLKEVRAGSFVG